MTPFGMVGGINQVKEHSLMPMVKSLSQKIVTSLGI